MAGVFWISLAFSVVVLALGWAAIYDVPGTQWFMAFVEWVNKPRGRK